MCATRGRLGSERGSVVVMMAVSLFMMLALAALAIDLGLLRDAKAESQRAADVIALAGASAFRDYPWTDALTSDSARVRALDIARLNKVRADTLNVENPISTSTPYAWGRVIVVETQDVTLNIIPDSQKVRAWVRRAGVRTFFAKLLARPFGHVQSMATAWATDNGPTVNCLKPFVMPDMWYESDKTTQDVNGNDYMDPITTVVGNTQDGESWKYQPASIGGRDYYHPYNPDSTPPVGEVQTGYGSGLRYKGGLSTGSGYDRDIGLPLLLKPQTGSGNTKPTAERMGNAFWMLDLNPDLDFKEEVASGCASASVGDSVPYDKGSKTAVRQPIKALVDQDPNATWNNQTHQLDNSLFDDWTQSPRVVTVALIDPGYWIANSANTKPDPGSKFSNFVRIFFLPLSSTGPPENIHALYIGPAPGGSGGPTGGPLVKILQLIQ
jgi:Putative Flp pilus-assembly TadE/G-like